MRFGDLLRAVPVVLHTRFSYDLQLETRLAAAGEVQAPPSVWRRMVQRHQYHWR